MLCCGTIYDPDGAKFCLIGSATLIYIELFLAYAILRLLSQADLRHFADHNNGGEIYFKLTWEGATILLVFLRLWQFCRVLRLIPDWPGRHNE